MADYMGIPESAWPELEVRYSSESGDEAVYGPEEMSTYRHMVRQWAIDEGIIYPNPDKLKDDVNSPRHYNTGGDIECIDYIKDFLTKEEFIGYLRGNIAKYMHRWRYKNGLEDLKKAQWYLNKLIEVEGEEKNDNS